MNPLLSFIVTEIIKEAPVLAIEVVQLLSKPAVTDEDWEKLKARYAGKTYEDYIGAAAKKPSA